MNESSYLLVRLAAVDGMLASLTDEDAVLRLGLEDERSALVRELAERDVIASPARRPDRGWQSVGEIARRVIHDLVRSPA